MNQIMIAFKGAKLILTSSSLKMKDFWLISIIVHNAGEIIHQTSDKIQMIRQLGLITNWRENRCSRRSAPSIKTQQEGPSSRADT